MVIKKIAFAAIAVLMAIASFDSAKGALIGPVNTPGVTEMYNLGGVDPFQVSETAWLIGSSAAPKDFGFSPSAGFWQKNLNTVDPVDPTSEQTIVEYLLNSGTTPWVSWTETLQTDGWTFDNKPADTDDTWYSIDGGTTKIPATVSLDGKVATYSFATPIASGQQVILHSEPLWGGPGPYLGNVGVAQVAVVVPEPAAAIGFYFAAGIGALCYLRHRWKLVR